MLVGGGRAANAVVVVRRGLRKALESWGRGSYARGRPQATIMNQRDGYCNRERTGAEKTDTPPIRERRITTWPLGCGADVAAQELRCPFVSDCFASSLVVCLSPRSRAVVLLPAQLASVG